MVLIAASVFTKGGKALVTRQYVADMTRARLEGLLDAFPKLVVFDKAHRQHTFVETDSVRYVYQPLDNLYMVLVTTKASNILEDLETLRIFSKVIPEYCRSNEESEITDKAFDLIFAFDEIVALGYRENVNLAQIRTFTEMDSQEERVHNQIQIAQQRAAQNTMTEKAKEIRRQEKLKKQLGKVSTAHGGHSSASSISSNNVSQLTTSASKDFLGGGTTGGSSSSLSDMLSGYKQQPLKLAGGGKALILGQKSELAGDAFIQQLAGEEKAVSVVVKNDKDDLDGSNRPKTLIRLKCIEKIGIEITRGGDLKKGEVNFDCKI